MALARGALVGATRGSPAGVEALAERVNPPMTRGTIPRAGMGDQVPEHVWADRHEEIEIDSGVGVEGDNGAVNLCSMLKWFTVGIRHWPYRP